MMSNPCVYHSYQSVYQTVYLAFIMVFLVLFKFASLWITFRLESRSHVVQTLAMAAFALGPLWLPFPESPETLLRRTKSDVISGS